MRHLGFLLLVCLGWATPAAAVWVALPAELQPDGPIYHLSSWRGDLIAVGRFRSFGDVEATNVARFDGTSWHALGAGVGWVDPQGWVQVAMEYDEDLVVGGAFFGAGDDPSTAFFARWDGESWSGMGALLNGRVSALGQFHGDLVIGGSFTTAGGRTGIDRVARFSGSWHAMGQGFNLYPSTFLTHGGLLYAGGLFSQAGGAAASSIASWDGSDWVVVGGGFDADLLPSAVFDLMLWDDTLYATGHFLRSGSERLQGVASLGTGQWNQIPGGGLSALDGEFWAFSMAAYQGEVYFAGKFDSAGGKAAGNIAAWNGQEWSPLGAGANGWVRSVLAHREALWVAGDFSRIGGLQQRHLSRWKVEPLSLGEPPVSDPIPVDPTRATLWPAYPSPFNPATTIRFGLPEDGPVQLRVLDARGSLVRELVSGEVAAGDHRVVWNGTDHEGRAVASGVYFVHLVADGHLQRGKLVLVR